MAPIKIYFQKDHYNPKYRGHVFPLLKPFLKPEDFTDGQRKAMYGISENDYKIVPDIEHSDICILTMSWNYYLKTKQIALAHDFIVQAKAAGKTVWSFVSGDHGVKHPDYNHVVVFRLGGYQSKHSNNHKGLPVFVGDYLSKHDLLEYYLPNTFSKKPLVGFCGQANASKVQREIDKIKKVWFNLKSLIGLSFYEPETLMATSYLRAKLLQR